MLAINLEGSIDPLIFINYLSAAIAVIWDIFNHVHFQANICFGHLGTASFVHEWWVDYEQKSIEAFRHPQWVTRFPMQWIYERPSRLDLLWEFPSEWHMYLGSWTQWTGSQRIDINPYCSLSEFSRSRWTFKWTKIQMVIYSNNILLQMQRIMNKEINI